mgnify:CR=1 FL=1
MGAPRTWRKILLILLVAAVPVAAHAQELQEQMEDLIERGFYNSAARVVGPELVESEPENAYAHYLYADALYLTGALEAARVSLDTAFELAAEPTAAMLHLRGLLLAQSGDALAGAQQVREAFSMSGEYEHAMDWGRLAWQSASLDEALAAFQAAAGTPRGERSSWPHLNRGRILSFLGREDEAITALQEAIRVFEAHDTGETRPSPAYVEAYYRIGEIYERRGLEQESESLLELALDHYRAALTGDPNYGPAARALEELSGRLL